MQRNSARGCQRGAAHVIRPPACSAALNSPHSGLEGRGAPIRCMGPLRMCTWFQEGWRGSDDRRQAPERYLRYLSRGFFTWAGRRSGANLIKRAAQRRFFFFLQHTLEAEAQPRLTEGLHQPCSGGPSRAYQWAAIHLLAGPGRAQQGMARHGMIQRGSAPPSREQPNLPGPSRMQRNSARGCQHP